jgi:myo-inositol-1(or 4)-monophosphatase
LPENNDQADTELLEAAVREGGGIAKSFAAGSNKSWSKADASPVSEADLAVDGYLNSVLLAARPNYGWLSEETTDNAARLSTKRVFVVDPIDGTSAFLKGLPHFTICAAVVDGSQPVAAAVYNPMMEECYTAQRGAGARLNGEPIHVSQRERLEGCRILANKSVLANPKLNWPAMERHNRDSAAYRLVLVASGAFDATISLTTKRDWDLAAAELIVREAGGIVSWHDGTIPLYNQASALHPTAIAAGPALHAQILSHLRQWDSP